MKYRYIGDEEPVLLIEHHKEVNKGDVIEVESPINSAFFVPVEEPKPNKQPKQEKSEEDAE